MAKDKISQYSTTNALNTDIGGIDIDENCLPSNLNDAVREVMVQLREFQNGDSGDPFVTANITATVAAISGGTINGTSVGATTPSTGAFTNFTASGTASFTSTQAVKLPVGTELQRPTPTAGMLRFNDDLNEFEGYNGTAWASVGGSAISNDTTTATDLFPTFVDATTGTAANVYTSNAKLLYKPSTGEFKSEALVATNGIVVNSATIDTDYTIAAGSNGHSVGPITVDAVVTVEDGAVWLVS
jgi:hypothetical protein